MRKSIAFLLVLTMVLSLGLTFGASIDDLQKQMEENEAKVAEKEAELQEVQAEAGSVEDAYWTTIAEIEELEERIAQTAGDIELKDEEIKITKEELREAQAEYDFQASEFGGRLKKMYLTKDESFWSLIFNAEGFEDLLMRISNYRRIIKMDEETMDKLNLQKLALEALEEKLQGEMEELEVLKELQEADKVLLDVKAVELEERKIQLQAMADEISEQISAEAAAGWEIQNQIDYLIEQARLMREREEAARREQERIEAERSAEENAEEGGSSSKDDYYDDEPNRGGDYVGGSWYWPTPGYYYVSYGFGNRIHPLYGTSDFHNGIDILGDAGAPILAARDGLVIYSGWMSGYGNCIIIDHGDGTQSLYGHGTGVATSVGDYVYAGNYIMPMGSTGVSTANHLHFGIMSGGVWVNPTAYVGG